MKLYFRPFPGLTIVTLIMLVILIWLGTWQYQRLQWKTGLLAEIESSVTAQPVTSFRQIQDALKDDTPLDFRRIDIQAEHVEFETPIRRFTAENKDVSWRLYTPVKQGGVIAFVGFEVIADKVDPIAKIPGPVRVLGYIRVVRQKNKLRVDSTPEANRWFNFNPYPDTHDWAKDVPGGADMRFYIDSVPEAVDAENLPIRRPEVRNNHFDYMLTWYGLALVLLIIYAVLHKREGRLGVKS